MKGERRELWIIEYNNYSSRRPSLIATSAYFKTVITSRFKKSIFNILTSYLIIA